MVNLYDIRYAQLGTRDLAFAVEYCTKILGLQLVSRERKTAYFRSDKVSERASRASRP
jgi:2,3-dihydroxy-p-cumate/2,3-dihydroxybenzoate 3,4-dioxygenase